MRAELKELERIVEKVAEKDPDKHGNVARAEVALKNAVSLDNDFKGRFSWGRGKISVKLVKPCKIVGFMFSIALLDCCAAKFSDTGLSEAENYIPLVALPTDVLRKLAEESVVA